MIDLSNKTVFITGIGSGIGLATAQVALKIGATVYGTVFSEEQLETITGYIPSESIYKVDVKNSDEIAFPTKLPNKNKTIAKLFSNFLTSYFKM